MDRNEQILSLIGLCLRGRNLEVGEEPVEAAVRARDARLLLLASDAADNTTRRVKHFAEVGQCVWLRVPFTKQALGRAVGRTSAAVAAITDIGLAVAVVRRLAEQSPEQYDEDLAKLELKAKRAQERKSEAAQHEKNLRRGIKRSKSADSTKKTAFDTAGSQRERAPALKQGHSQGSRSRNSGKAAPVGTRRSQPTTGDKGNGKSHQKSGSRFSQSNRPKTWAKPNPYAHSRPVKKGKGPFRKKES